MLVASSTFAAPSITAACCAGVNVSVVVFTPAVRSSSVFCVSPPLATSVPEIAPNTAPNLPSGVVPTNAPSVTTSGVSFVISPTPNACATSPLAIKTAAASGDGPAFSTAMLVNAFTFSTKLPPLVTPAAWNTPFKSLANCVAASV